MRITSIVTIGKWKSTIRSHPAAAPISKVRRDQGKETDAEKEITKTGRNRAKTKSVPGPLIDITPKQINQRHGYTCCNDGKEDLEPERGDLV